MAAHPIVVVDDLLIERLPEPYRSDPRYQRGARLELVPVISKELSSLERTKAWDEFMKLRGLLADSEYDPNAELERERQFELEKEARWARTDS